MTEEKGTEKCLLLKGSTGLVEGEEFSIRYGQTVLIGRSRHCDICLKLVKKYEALSETEKDRDDDFLTVSRRHLRLAFYNSQNVELEDMSANGTFLDGQKIEKAVIEDIKKNSHEIRLGSREAFQLVWGEVPVSEGEPASEEPAEEEPGRKKPPDLDSDSPPPQSEEPPGQK